jgi:ATP-dependent helicase HrpB
VLPLPIDRSLPEIVAAARGSRSLVLVAEPGAGKTTRVAPALLSANVLTRDHPAIVMLQPRRVAARAAAQRIADERGWELGREVGYHVRFDRRIGRDTRLRVLTEGILTRQLLDDPFLEGVGAVLLDEFHERNIHSDLAIALLREIRQTVRPDLVLIVMSATLDAEPVARFLGHCPIIRVEGRMFPVDVEHVSSPVGMRADAIAVCVADAVDNSLRAEQEAGDVLVFLPGAEEIRRSAAALDRIARERDLLVLPLHGSLTAEEQTAALKPASRRKVILATNIAETSLTIDGVRTVIDSGLARVAGYDPRRGMDRLELSRISRASATQRAGRAGRTAPGRCIRLWTTAEDRALEAFELPEVRRVDLCGVVLSLHAWGKSDVRAFGWFEAPSDETIFAAERLLAMLGALDAETGGQITPLGRRLLAMPAHPRLARLLATAAEMGMLAEGATLAALMEEKDIVRRELAFDSPVSGSSDLLWRMELLESWDDIDPGAARQVIRARDALLRIAQTVQSKHVTPPADREAAMLQLILLAYPDRVARRRVPGGNAAAIVGGGGVKLASESVVRQAEFFVALDAQEDQRSTTREALVRIASAVRVEWLEECLPQSIRREREIVFDETRQRVVGRGRVWYRDLLLREDQDAPVDAERAGEVLAEALHARAEEIFGADESAAQWLARLRFLQTHLPEHAWPLMDAGQLGELLSTACRNKRSVEELSRGPLVSVLASSLQYPLDRLLDEHAPVELTAPSGSRIRLDYRSGVRPILAVRLQEVFGWVDTPRLALGRVSVLLHLLGPNFRPVQITDDLRSFWKTAYFQVRKDLRTRYPKHAWPEDPLTAKPEARGGHRPPR